MIPIGKVRALLLDVEKGPKVIDTGFSLWKLRWLIKDKNPVSSICYVGGRPYLVVYALHSKGMTSATYKFKGQLRGNLVITAYRSGYQSGLTDEDIDYLTQKIILERSHDDPLRTPNEYTSYMLSETTESRPKPTIIDA